MWLSHKDSEVNKFHPVCEKALNAALKKISKDADYRVVHHEYTGTLEMDFAIQNTKTGKYLCVVEVKRTPSDVNSARYQYQAMSYVQNSAPVSEAPFFVLTNLEYALAFRYDSGKPRVFQQMLEPGLIHIGDFSDFDENQFVDRLADYFAELISNFLSNSFNYLATLEQFERFMKSISGSTAKWKSSLVVLLYEYIRGAFLSVGRKDLPMDVRKFTNNVERICREAATVNFKEIFTYSPHTHEKIASISSDVLANIFDFGKQSILGDSVAGILHSIVSEDMKHEGVVLTDLELARAMAVLAKGLGGEIGSGEYICDPAAGSGNLISAAAGVFNIAPGQIKANDINERLLELLSLRIGLDFAKAVSRHNSAEITSENIADLPKDYFDNVKVIVMNPPFVAGIDCVERKRELFKRISELKTKDAATNVGQMNLGGVFLETVCSLCKPGTIISCVLPKTYLAARGREAVALREYLLTDFGLKAIFTYPEDGLFEGVDKATCVVVGEVGAAPDAVKIISGSMSVADIDLHLFERAISDEMGTEEFTSIAPGIEGFAQSRGYLISMAKAGWRHVCMEFAEAIRFQQESIQENGKLVKMSGIGKGALQCKRGSAGSFGASDLLMMDRNKSFFQENKSLPTIPAMRNAKLESLLIADGDTACFDAASIDDDELESVIDKYLEIPVKKSRQQRKGKSSAELTALLKSVLRKTAPANSVLVPRGIRSQGRAYVTEKSTVVSTNFLSITMQSREEALILASWFSTIFYQLICEINAKPQEGMRKMEVGDIEETYIPVIEKLAEKQKRAILAEVKSIKFVELNRPEIRGIDRIWAEILYGCEAEARLDKAVRLLEFLANNRNRASVK